MTVRMVDDGSHVFTHSLPFHPSTLYSGDDTRTRVAVLKPRCSLKYTSNPKLSQVKALIYVLTPTEKIFY